MRRTIAGWWWMSRLSRVSLLFAALGLFVPLHAFSAEWQYAPNMPLAVNCTGAALDNQGKIYIPGGYASGSPGGGNRAQSVLQCFDPDTNQWSSLAPMQKARAFLAVASDRDGKVYAIGGLDINDSPLQCVERYDPSTGAWTYVAPLPFRWSGCRAVTDTSGKIYVAGGYDDSWRTLNSLYVYDPAANTWSALPGMWTARTYLGLGIDRQDRLYAVGGVDPSGIPLSSVERYDPRTNTWSYINDIAWGRQVGAVVSGRDGSVYVAGGYPYTGDAQWFNPATEMWESIASLQAPRNNMAGAMSRSGVIFLFGGDAGFRQVGTVESYAAGPFNRQPVANAGPDQTVEAAGTLTTVQLDGSGSYDPDGDAIDYEWSVPAGSGARLDDPHSARPTGQFPVGPTLLTLTVSDGITDPTTDDVLITVVDGTPPVVICTTDKAMLWPPNHQIEKVHVCVQASDAVTAGNDLVVYATVESSEPDDALGDGEFTGDVNGQDGFEAPVPISLVYDPTLCRYVGVVNLRAERDGANSGRTYSIVAKVIDAAGNFNTASCVVVVPHDRKKK